MLALWPGGAAVIGAITVCWNCLRLALVVLVAILFNQPEWVEEYRPRRKANDRGAVRRLGEHGHARRGGRGSIADVDGDRGARRSRRSWTARSGIRCEDRLAVEIQALLAGRDRAAARICTSRWPTLLERYQQSARHRAGLGRRLERGAAAGASRLGPAAQGYSGVRGAGRQLASRLPDVELLSLDVPTFGIAGKSVRIPFTIESTLPREHMTTVVLKTSDGDEVTKEVAHRADGPHERLVDLEAARLSGDYTLTLDVPVQGDELLADNNRLGRRRSRSAKKSCACCWSNRFRAGNIAICAMRCRAIRASSCRACCFIPGLSKVGGGNKDYIKQFPQGLDELSKFDVVFLGDVGMEEGQLHERRLPAAQGDRRASGQRTGLHARLAGPASCRSSTRELGDLCPVVLDPAQPGGWGSRTAEPLGTDRNRPPQLAHQAGRHAGRQYRRSGRTCRAFNGTRPVSGPRLAREVLCVHKDASNEFGRLPLLVTRTFGAGKVLFMGTDGAWRWRKGVEDKYHYRFWGQVVRWMAYQRNMAKGETMRMYYSPEQPQVRQTIALSANVMRTQRRAASARRRHGPHRGPLRQSRNRALHVIRRRMGRSSPRATRAEEPGRHEVTLACKQTGATLETSFFVQGALVERIGRAARPEVLEEIARVTRGKVIRHRPAGRSVAFAWRHCPSRPPSVRRVQLWCHPAVMVPCWWLCWAFFG